MKIRKTTNAMFNHLNTKQLYVTDEHLLKKVSLPVCLAIVMSISLGFVTQSVRAESQNPVSKPADGKGALPSFAQADINGDHFVTKHELKNFPFLLQVFDKVDAGEDGKLEQHEYQNLEMETKKEGEVR